MKYYAIMDVTTGDEMGRYPAMNPTEALDAYASKNGYASFEAAVTVGEMSPDKIVAEEIASVPWDQMETVRPGCTEAIDRTDPRRRAGMLAIASANGATIAELARIAAAPYASVGDTVAVGTRFGHLSRGKVWARQGKGAAVVWAKKSGGTVHLTPGNWTVGSDDGYKRKERVGWTVSLVAGVLVAE